jgi:DnaJ-class molecular chaperone
MQGRNHYDTLGIARQADAVVVKAAYKALMMKYHPDRFPAGSAEAERAATKINEAFAILGDPEKRALYDRDMRLVSPSGGVAGPEVWPMPSFTARERAAEERERRRAQKFTITWRQAFRGYAILGFGVVVLVVIIPAVCIGLFSLMQMITKKF